MNARDAASVASIHPLVGVPENVESLPRKRVPAGHFWASVKWAASVMKWLVISIALFVMGFLCGVAAALLTVIRFTGGEVAVELLIVCGAGFLITLWASGACWEKMRGVSARRGQG